jgi:hypothetical protein
MMMVDPGTICPPFARLHQLYLVGALPRFVAAGAPRGDLLGNCHAAVAALMDDLKAAGETDWIAVRGLVHFDRVTDHSWIEFGDWCFEVTNCWFPGSRVHHRQVLFLRRLTHCRGLALGAIPWVSAYPCCSSRVSPLPVLGVGVLPSLFGAFSGADRALAAMT